MGMLTVDTLMKRSRGEVVLPRLSELEGSEQKLVFQWISQADRSNFGPMPPPNAHTWIDEKAILALPKAERPAALDAATLAANERAYAWFNALPLELQERRRAQARDEIYQVIAYASLEPRLTVDEARRLGPDAPIAYHAILVASGLVQERPADPPAEKGTEADPAELKDAA